MKLQGKVKITDKVTSEEEMTIKNVPKRAQLEAPKKVHLKNAIKREKLQLNAIRDKKAQSKVVKRDNVVPLKNAIRKEFAK